jgi:subtilisin family serine protease
VAWDAATSSLLVADLSNNRVRMVAYPSGVVTTLAGNGGCCSTADGPALASNLNSPRAVIPALPGAPYTSWVSMTCNGLQGTWYSRADAGAGGAASGVRWGSGAVDNTTGAGRITSFSQRMVAPNTIFAPGAFMRSTIPGNRYDNMGGTSQAAPVVAGAAALPRCCRSAW